VAQFLEALRFRPEGRGFDSQWHNPSGRTMALGLTQLLTEMSTRNTSCWVKAAGAYSWRPYHLYVQTVLKSWSRLPPGNFRPCPGLRRDYRTLYKWNRRASNRVGINSYCDKSFVTFLSHSKQIPRKCIESATTVSFHIPQNSRFINFRTIRR
jgi:hypothetical protein